MKRLLISLFVWLFWLVSFWYCSYYMSTFTNISIQYWKSETLSPWCYRVWSAWAANYLYFSWYFDENDNYVEWYKLTNVDWLYCSDEDFLVYYPWWWNSSYNVRFYDVFSVFSWSSDCPACPTCPTCPDCPVCDECSYSWYILESEIDTNYCVSNWLCPIQEFSWFSNLYVNDILFMPSAIYDLTIPEEFEFDYTWNENLLEIDIKGYNTDSDYIAWIISTQNNYPNDSYFNSIITDLVPKLIPWLVIILFIYFIFRFIKKIF